MASREPRLGGSELVDLRDAVVAALRVAFPVGVKTIEKHRGEWTAASVKSYSRRAPALIVIAHGTTEAQTMGTSNVRTSLSLSVAVMASINDGDADDPCLLMVRALLGLISENTWGLECVSAPESIRAQNLYTGKADGPGINLWAVTWEQPIDLPAMTPEEFALLGDYLTTTTDHEPASAGEDEPAQTNEFEMNP